MENKQNQTVSQSPVPSMRSPFSTALVIAAEAPNNAVTLVKAMIFMVSLTLLTLFVNPSTAMAQSNTTRLSVTNQCDFPVWMATQPNTEIAPLPEGTVKLEKGQSQDYAIPSDGWAGRLWPKTGCDSNGTNCAAGEAVQPCPPSGCNPPADTLIEFNFSNLSSTNPTWYDISLVDGYSLPIEIKPREGESGSCITTRCDLSLNDCPQDETQGLGDLRVINNENVVQCLSPCKKWSYPSPPGLGKPETESPGIYLCCIAPLTGEECSTGPVIQTQYVQTVRQACPTTYSYAYDDAAGLHDCPTQNSFDVMLCP